MISMPVGAVAQRKPAVVLVPGARPAWIGNSGNINSQSLPGDKNLTLAAGLALGDLVIAVVELRNDEADATASIADGTWTRLTGSPFGGTSKIRFELFWKIADADDASSTVVVTPAGGTTVDRVVIRSMYYRAANGFAAVPIVGMTTAVGTATPAAHPALTADNDNQLGVTYGGVASSQASFGAWSGGSGGTWTEHFFFQSGAAQANDILLSSQSAPLTKAVAATGGSKTLSPTALWTTVGFRLVPANV